MSKLIPISSIEIKGETIKDVIFINIGGGDKTILVFESGKILLMPVYRECPVQFGSIADIQGDLDTFLQILAQDKIKLQADLDQTSAQIKELKQWPILQESLEKIG